MTDTPLPDDVRELLAKPNPIRDRRRVNAWIEVDSWHGWGAADRS